MQKLEYVFNNKSTCTDNTLEGVVRYTTLGASVMLLSSSVDTWNSQDRLSTDTYNVYTNCEWHNNIGWGHSKLTLKL